MTLHTGDRPRIASKRHALLGGWRDIMDDVSRLAMALQQVPDECKCGDGAAHLGGTCVCCQTNKQTIDCIDCGALLRRLDARVEALRENGTRFLPTVEVVAQSDPDDAYDRHAQLQMLKGTLATLLTRFGRLDAAVGEFRSGCSTAQLHEIKDLAGNLLISARRLDNML